VYTTEFEDILDCYSLAEILEMNDLSEADALELLVEQGVELPQHKPI
jgi:hypothetical protein